MAFETKVRRRPAPDDVHHDPERRKDESAPVEQHEFLRLLRSSINKLEQAWPLSMALMLAAFIVLSML
jgi:hypothetical protein